MRIKPLWIILAGGIVLLGVLVDLALVTNGENDEAADSEPAPASTTLTPSEGRAELPGLRGQRQLEEARWQEARVAARTVAQALRAHHTRLGGFQGVHTGVAVEQASLGISASSLNLTYFSAHDIRITELRSEDGYFEIEVRGSLAHSPSGVLRLNARGEETRSSR